VIPCGTYVPVAVWQPCELLYTCYLLTSLLTHVFTRPSIEWPTVPYFPRCPVFRSPCSLSLLGSSDTQSVPYFHVAYSRTVYSLQTSTSPPPRIMPLDFLATLPPSTDAACCYTGSSTFLCILCVFVTLLTSKVLRTRHHDI